ncbi:MAG: ribosome-associated translation inhibitor RaiA [bacterium]|nr:ribosome-associated translation inhibitor RaiA [bacterium]
MEIFIRGDKVKVTKAMNDYIVEKLGKLDKYFDDSSDIRANVVIKIKSVGQKVEVTIPLKKFILRAEETQEDVYAAVDVIIDKIERQIRKNKTKLSSKKVKNTDLILDSIEDIEEEKTNVIKRKQIEVKPMSEEEAIIQMELLGHNFYLFKDDKDDTPTLVYKRSDGNYGIIETK